MAPRTTKVAPRHTRRRLRRRRRASRKSASVSGVAGDGLSSTFIDATIASLMSSVKSASGSQGALLGHLAVDRNDVTLLHDQVAAEIRRAITDGEAGPGERIPQAKDLAAVLGVTPT